MRQTLVDEPWSLDWIIDCVNEYSTATRSTADELDRPLPELAGGPAQAAGLSTDDLIAVANGWFEVFQAAPDARAVAGVINDLLEPAVPAVVAAGEGDEVRSAIRLAADLDERSRLSVWGALILLDTAASIGVDRLGTCAGDRCVDVYVDRSPRHNRRYCSQLCQTRERVSRYRGRR